MVKEGNYYGAQQMYKSTCARYFALRIARFASFIIAKHLYVWAFIWCSAKVTMWIHNLQAAPLENFQVPWL